MSFLGLDYGEKKIGLAKSAGSLAVPLCVIENNSRVIQNIEEICQQEGISKIIVGMPKGMKGQAGSQSEKVQSFVGKLRRHLYQDIITEDERLSSKQAKRLLERQKAQDDAVAAMLILQSYLDRGNS